MPKPRPRNATRISKLQAIEEKRRDFCPTCKALPGRKCINLGQKLYVKEMENVHRARTSRAKQTVRKGLCPERERHPSHPHTSDSLGSYLCTGDPDDREPYRSERRRQRAKQAVQEEEEA